jgi:hypothetical protein
MLKNYVFAPNFSKVFYGRTPGPAPPYSDAVVNSSNG